MMSIWRATNFHVLYVCVRFLNYYFILSIFCNFLSGCVCTKRICKSYVLFCVCVCVRLFFFGSEGFFIHLELLLRVWYCEREKEGVEKGTDWFSFFLLATQRRKNNRPQDHTHTMRNWVSTYLLNLKKSVGHCCNNQLHHSHIWRIFAIPCSLQQ